MITHRFPVDRNEVNYFFFSAQFKYKDIFFQIAVCETIMTDGDFTGGYDVLLVCVNGTANFRMHQVQSTGAWQSSNQHIAKEMLPVIGDIISAENKKVVAEFAENVIRKN